MKNKHFIYIAIIFGQLSYSADLQAEFSCESKIGYTFELLPAEPTSIAHEGKAPAATPTVATESKESTVYIAVAAAKGADQDKAKAALQKESARHLQKAREECHQRHENVGSCLASKFETSSSAMRTMSFSARKALEEALKKDCEAQRGRCKKVEATEAVCTEIVAPVVASPAAEEGKDDKKKGKK